MKNKAEVAAEVRRRRWFHGWAFEDRGPEAVAALRRWLVSGEENDELAPADRRRIAGFHAAEEEAE